MVLPKSHYSPIFTMITATTREISMLVSHTQYVTWCVAVENAILAAGANTSLEGVVTEPVRPIITEKLVSSATDMQVYFA
jgi:hypothetical protein